MINMLQAAAALFVNGFGVYLTMHADIGAGPWDVFNLGISKTLGILYGTASISVSFAILIIDVLLKEPIGIAMFIDSLVVGKSVDLFELLNIVPKPGTLPGAVIMQLAFRSVKFDATKIRHQRLRESGRVFLGKIMGNLKDGL